VTRPTLLGHGHELGPSLLTVSWRSAGWRLPLPTVVLTCPGSATLVSGERQNRQIGTALPLAVMTRIRRQNGGYTCGHTKTEVALRDELPVSLCPRLAGFALID
jgi:hypothetical protein